MRVSKAGVHYGPDNGEFIPWYDPFFRPKGIIRGLGFTAFAAAVTVGSVPGGFAAALAMEALGTSRASGVQGIADVAEC